MTGGFPFISPSYSITWPPFQCSSRFALASAVEGWVTASRWQSWTSKTDMWLGDLKRAVEDVILRPEDNAIHMLEKRGTIAALDLCQVFFVSIKIKIFHFSWILHLQSLQEHHQLLLWMPVLVPVKQFLPKFLVSLLNYARAPVWILSSTVPNLFSNDILLEFLADRVVSYPIYNPKGNEAIHLPTTTNGTVLC